MPARSPPNPERAAGPRRRGGGRDLSRGDRGRIPRRGAGRLGVAHRGEAEFFPCAAEHDGRDLESLLRGGGLEIRVRRVGSAPQIFHHESHHRGLGFFGGGHGSVLGEFRGDDGRRFALRRPRRAGGDAERTARLGVEAGRQRERQIFRGFSRATEGEIRIGEKPIAGEGEQLFACGPRRSGRLADLDDGHVARIFDGEFHFVRVNSGAQCDLQGNFVEFLFLKFGRGPWTDRYADRALSKSITASVHFSY